MCIFVVRVCVSKIVVVCESLGVECLPPVYVSLDCFSGTKFDQFGLPMDT